MAGEICGKVNASAFHATQIFDSIDSLHYGEQSGMGVGNTTPMRALVMANVSRNFIFQSMPGPEFIAGEANLWTCRFYGSENALNEPA